MSGKLVIGDHTCDTRVKSQECLILQADKAFRLGTRPRHEEEAIYEVNLRILNG